MEQKLVASILVFCTCFSMISAQVKEIGCLLTCEHGLMPGQCKCNPEPRIACMLNCDNGLVPGKCKCNPSNVGIEQLQISCYLDCPSGSKLVESECRCEKVASIVQTNPCKGVSCAQFQQCRVINGRGLCVLSFFPNLYNWTRRTVKDSLQDRCSQKREVGNCREAKRRYYYDQRSRRCIRFYYGGCGGNQNNFHTLMECLRRCSKAV